MNPRLYALLILIGTIAFFVLLYLYFFVFYTASLVINANVDGYRVDFFSPATAQKRQEICEKDICEIGDVSPFDYTLTLSKENYKNITIPVKIKARKRQEFFVEFEKKARLEELVLQEKAEETSQQKISRLREENLYIASFKLSDEEKITFSEKGDRMIFEYRNATQIQKIADFARISQENIFAEYIGQTQKIFLRLADSYYIFDRSIGRLYELPFDMKVLYVKPARTLSHYLIVTQKGTFLYDTATKSSEFQYQFRDFVPYDDALIGVIYDDEVQKKQNFNLTEKGNLVILYRQSDRSRKVLLATDMKIDRIELQDKKVIVSAGEKQYELQNF